jgi:hypothetical protein
MIATTRYRVLFTCLARADLMHGNGNRNVNLVILGIIIFLIFHCPRAVAAEQASITVATISHGALVIVGQAAPGSKVTLVEPAISTTADQQGLFTFSTTFHPSDCIVKVSTGIQTLSAVVEQCGEAGPVGPGGPPGLVGYERVKQECDQAGLTMGYCLASCPPSKVLFGGSCSGAKFVVERSGANPSAEQWRCFGQLPLTGQITTLAFCAAVAN